MTMTGHSGGKSLFPRLYREGRYLFLLVSLLLLFFFYPFFDKLRFAPQVLGVLFFAILLSSVSAVSADRKSVAAASVLAVVSFGSFVSLQFHDSTFLVALACCALGLFFLLIAVVVLRHIMRVSEVTTDTILGAICTYLLLGMVWTMIYTLIETFLPGSFLRGGESIAAGFADSQSLVISSFIYYSFVTLTTLGYGDITPNSSPAAAMSSLEAVAGQLYLAILIARFVGLHIASVGKDKE
jgi:hypothetical protein